MQQLLLRPIEPSDAPKIMGLIHELAEFENMRDQVELTAERLAEDIKNQAILGFIAKDGDILAGMNLFFFTYSTWQGQCVHMEDLYVNPAYRRQGVGKKLWAELAKFCKERGCKRLQWNVLDWNKDAIQFYEKMPCTNLSKTEGWYLYRMGEDDIAHLASVAKQ